MICYSDVCKLAERANVIPVFERLPSDLETPVSTYLKLAARKEVSFLLEWTGSGEKPTRYSIIGYDPFLLLESTPEGTALTQGASRKELTAPPADVLTELFSVYRPATVVGLPSFTGGGVGYFSYDFARAGGWGADAGDTGLPDVLFGIYARVIVLDHNRQEITVIANILHDHEQRGLKAKYTRAKAEVSAIVSQLTRSLRTLERKAPRTTAQPVPEISPERFGLMVRIARQHLKASDMSRVFLARRWRVSSNEAPLEIYRRLRRLSPSPYLYLMNFGDRSVLGASPSMMVRVEHRQIETCDTGQIGSGDGRLRRGEKPLDALFERFPVEAVTGFPKPAAMELIENLESPRRGLCGGAVTLLDFGGNLASCPAIETIVRTSEDYYAHTGALITTGTTPARALHETDSKAEALFLAVTGKRRP